MLKKDNILSDNSLWDIPERFKKYRIAINESYARNIEQACYLPEKSKAVKFLINKAERDVILAAFHEPDLGGKVGVIIEDKLGGHQLWERVFQNTNYVPLSPYDFNEFWEGNKYIKNVLALVKPVNKYIVMPDRVDLVISSTIECLFKDIATHAKKYKTLIQEYICYEWVFIASSICSELYHSQGLNGMPLYDMCRKFLNDYTKDTYYDKLKDIIHSALSSSVKTHTLEALSSYIINEVTNNTKYEAIKKHLSEFYTQELLSDIMDELGLMKYFKEVAYA